MHYKMNYAAYETRLPDLHPSYPPAGKSTTSRSHLRKPEALSSRPRPFDPDDLTRRLYVVLAEQQAHAERKRRARAAVEAESEAKRAAVARSQAQTQDQQVVHSTSAAARESRPGAPTLRLQTGDAIETSNRKPSRHSLGVSPKDGELESPKSYHHVPQVAASQFARTTTAEPLDDKNLIHKLSKRALKAHVDELNSTASIKRSDSLRRTRSLRDQLEQTAPQNTYYRLASTTEVDENPVVPTAPKSLFRDFKNSKSLEQDQKQIRRKSMGDMLQRIAAAFDPPTETAPLSPIDGQPTLSHCEVAVLDAEEHRVDWTQSDEITNQPKSANPLRKTESRWGLKSRLGSFRKHKGDNNQMASPIEEKEKQPPVVPPKSPSKPGFLARFRRS